MKKYGKPYTTVTTMGGTESTIEGERSSGVRGVRFRMASSADFAFNQTPQPIIIKYLFMTPCPRLFEILIGFIPLDLTVKDYDLQYILVPLDAGLVFQ